MTICQRAEDEALSASAVVQLARVLHDLGHPRHAFGVAVTVAGGLAPPDPHTTPPARLHGYGALLLQAATAAGGCGDRHSVRELLDRAAEAAALLGEESIRYGASFGPVAVDLTRAVTALDLGDHADGLALHRQLLDSADFQRLPIERRAAYLVDVAARCVRLGDLPEAGSALLLADRAAPAEVRHRPAARHTLRILVRRTTRPAPEIVRLAELLRIAA
jgi:hypothetical protein